jgi:hypothetical protein
MQHFATVDSRFYAKVENILMVDARFYVVV